nr:glycosyltransferase [Patulibacter sp. SYSU D01012]
MRVCVVAEFYPRADDPVLGVWAHQQALAARDAGAEVHVLVLHRPVPPRATRPRDVLATLRRMRAQPRHAVLDGIPVTYVRFHSPGRGRTYGSWGRWAARPLARALRRLRRTFPYDVVHAHNAVPAGDAVRRAGRRATGGAPLLVSVHGGDVYYTAPRSRQGEAAVRATFAAATGVLANSSGTADRCAALGATRVRVVRLGTDLPPADDLLRWHEERVWRAPTDEDAPVRRRARGRWGSGQLLSAPPATEPAPTLVTVAHVVPRKRHADVLRALWLLRDRHPCARYRIIGDGPERPALERLANELGLTDRVEWRGQLPHAQALEAAREADVFVMPSVDEAFGVAYVEAMAAAMPVVAALGEPGPHEIADAGEGIVLVPPGDVGALADALDRLLRDPGHRRTLGRAARRTVEDAFTWSRCGRQTVRAYRAALPAGPSAGGAAPPPAGAAAPEPR